MAGNLKMTVNVSLCGATPRSEMISCSSQCRPRLHQTEVPPSRTDQIIAMAASSLSRKVSEDDIVSNSQVIEPPSWAVPARGEAFLEPVSESRLLHRSTDLTTQAVYHIGRSDTSDLQLLHCASSRRHAILFHHPNGHCYLVDCGSAHGTFVNGHKVENTVTKNGVVPHRVKKGAIVRFGGPGAPAFILKSFSVTLNSLMQHLERRKTITRKTNIIQDDPPLSYIEKHSDSDFSLDALVTVNTRLNSVQSVSEIPLSGSSNYSKTAAFLNSRGKNSSLALHLRKRSLVSFDEDAVDEQDHKRLKLSGSIESDASNESINPAIVSPSRGKSVLQFDFSMIDRPVVSPNPFEDAAKTLELSTGSLANSIFTVPLSLSLPTTRKKKKVLFSKAPPQIFFPASVTPDSLSD